MYGRKPPLENFIKFARGSGNGIKSDKQIKQE